MPRYASVLVTIKHEEGIERECLAGFALQNLPQLVAERIGESGLLEPSDVDVQCVLADRFNQTRYAVTIVVTIDEATLVAKYRIDDGIDAVLSPFLAAFPMLNKPNGIGVRLETAKTYWGDVRTTRSSREIAY